MQILRFAQNDRRRKVPREWTIETQRTMKRLSAAFNPRSTHQSGRQPNPSCLGAFVSWWFIVPCGNVVEAPANCAHNAQCSHHA
jgi:hypothetical protein